MLDITTALGIISFLLALILSIVSYLYVSQRRDINHRIGRLEKAIINNGEKDEKDRKELEDRIEKHYAYKSDITRLETILDRFEKDIIALRLEQKETNSLLTSILVEIKAK
jgi:membrane-associated HD superfamily phosphohydrolase